MPYPKLPNTHPVVLVALLKHVRRCIAPYKPQDSSSLLPAPPTHFGLRLCCIMSTARSAPSSSASMRRRSYDTTSAANAAATCGSKDAQPCRRKAYLFTMHVPKAQGRIDPSGTLSRSGAARMEPYPLRLY